MAHHRTIGQLQTMRFFRVFNPDGMVIACSLMPLTRAEWRILLKD